MRAEQDLALIRQLMEQTRREVRDRGRHLVIWGVLTTLGLVVTYLAVVGAAALNPTWAWLAIMAVGWAASFGVGWRDGRGARVHTAGRRLLSAVWIATGLTLTAVGLAGLLGSVVDVRALPGLVSVVVAAPVALTAVLTAERWLIGVAAGWWLAGGVMLFVPGVYTLLLMAVLSAALLAGPGVVLNVRARRRSSSPMVYADAE